MTINQDPTKSGMAQKLGAGHLIEKKALRPPQKREAIRFMIEEHGLSRGAFYREPTDWLTRDSAVIEALSGLTEEFPRLAL